MSKQRYYIDTEGNDDNAYLEAMQFACELAVELSGIDTIILYINTKSNTGWFERALGNETTKNLFKGVKFKDCRTQFKFETVRTLKDRVSEKKVVIACGMDSDDIFPIDDFYSVKAIIAIPWLQEGIAQWVQTWGAKEIRENIQSPTYPEPSCIVQRALEEITGFINMSTGLSHAEDEKYAKTIVRALFKYEKNLDSDSIRYHLVNKLGWHTDHASEVESLFNTLNEGRYFKGGQTSGLRDYYKQWKKECEQGLG